MLSNHNRPSTFGKRFCISAVASLTLFVLAVCVPSWAQTTISTGSVVGTVTDPSGALVSGAKVIVTNTATSQTIELTTNAAGYYNSGALAPGNYRVQVSAKGFSSVITSAAV